MIRKRMTIFLIIVGISIIHFSLWGKEKEKKKMIINVEGFEVEYNSTDSNFVLEVFDDIKLGSSMREISDELGEPDAWIGSGMMRPVYFLEDDRVVVLHFEYPAACDKLKQIVLIEENGESKVLKEK